jgi:hypothetical protein
MATLIGEIIPERPGRVSEVQLMEIKQETIRDGKFGHRGGVVV